MGQIALSIPVSGLPNSTEDPKIASDFNTLQTLVNGNLDYTNVSPTAGFWRFGRRAVSGVVTAASGDLLIAQPSSTIALPAPALNAIVGIFAVSTVVSATAITVNGTNLYGPGLTGVSSCKLGAPGAHVVFQSDGTNWYVVGGQVDSGWVPIAIASGAVSPHGLTDAAAVRQQGSVVRLKGGIYVTGSGFASLSTIATVPAAYREPGNYAAHMGAYLAAPNTSIVPSTYLIGGATGTGSNGPGQIYFTNSPTGLNPNDLLLFDTTWRLDE